MILGRRADGGRSSALDGEAERLVVAASATALARQYAEGLAHGMRTTLRLLLGVDTDGVPGFAGSLTPESERWARDALARVEEEHPT